MYKRQQYAKSSGLNVSAYGTKLSNLIAGLFPKPVNSSLKIDAIDIKENDKCLLAFDDSNRLKAVLYRWFSVTGGNISQPTWVQFTYVIYGASVNKIENKLVELKLKEYEL